MLEWDRTDEPLHVFTVDELLGRPPREYILKGILAAGELSVWAGPPKTGKSFLLMHLGWRIAQGRPAFGRRVRQTRVIYLAAEGASGLPGRLRALLDAHGPAPGFLLVPERRDLGRPHGDINTLIAAVTEYGAGLVVLDTLNRTFGAADENNSADMGDYAANLDRIRAETGAHVAIVHHTPKNGGGPRGHSSLSGAADAIIDIAKADDGALVATLEGAKDDASGAAMGFRLRTVELGLDADGDPRTTCLVEETEAPGHKPPILSDLNRIGLDRLRDAVAAHGERLPEGEGFPTSPMLGVRIETWRQAVYAARPAVDQETRRRGFTRTCEALTARRLIGAQNGWVWPVSDPDNG